LRTAAVVTIPSLVPEVAGPTSPGRTRDEARTNVLDALALMLEPGVDLPVGDREPLTLTIER